MKMICIEDYAVSFLRQIKAQTGDDTIRLALFGHAEKEAEDEKFMIYGAACAEEKNWEEIGQEFFAGYDLIGFVNINRNGIENRKTEYNIFFDENVAMQDYLLYYHHTYRQEAAGGISSAEVRQEGLPVMKNSYYSAKPSKGIWDKLKMILIGCLCIIAAIAVVIIDDYTKMKDFTEMAMQVISFIK